MRAFGNFGKRRSSVPRTGWGLLHAAPREAICSYKEWYDWCFRQQFEVKTAISRHLILPAGDAWFFGLQKIEPKGQVVDEPASVIANFTGQFTD